MKPGWTRRVVTVCGGVAFTVVVFGFSFQPLLLPAYTASLVITVDAPARTGLPPEQAQALAEDVRAFVAGARGVELPGQLPDGRPAFEPDAVEHLVDVREVVAAGRAVAWMALLLGCAWAAWCLLGPVERRDLLARSLRGAALAVAATVAIAALAAVADFDTFFARFHDVFFEPGTWTFPADALLIRLFPESFWVASGIWWGGLSLLGAALLAVCARLVVRYRSERTT